MLTHISKVLKNRPLLAVEHMMYILLVTAGVWGLSPNNSALSIERLINQFGVYVVIGQFALFLVVGVLGHLSIITVRIEHRIHTTRLAFLVFAYGGIANLGVYVFGGEFNPISLMLYSFSMLVAGIIHLHLRMQYRLGLRGRKLIPR